TAFDNRDKEKIDSDITTKLDNYNMNYYFGKNSLEHLIGFDYIFRAPSCRPDTPEIVKEVERGAILTSEIEKVLELAPCKVVGVTGSDGKTTTTTLIYKILEANGY